jgi:aryl-alcohol dehydrogenase-like predicted oxidoreductase
MGFPRTLALRSRMMERMRNELSTPEGKAKIEKVKGLAKVAEELDTTIAALSLAWCLKNPNVSTVITGASKPEQVTMNVKALDLLPKMTDDVMQKIEDIVGNKPTSYVLSRSTLLMYRIHMDAMLKCLDKSR